LLLPAEEALPSDEPTLDKSAWDLAEVQAGVAFLHGELLDTFVPQMLNYESIGGVNFKKGCYPGQEVVARSQFRGTLKRRCALLHSPLPLAQGDLVFSSEDPEQACGTVVLAAPRPEGGGYDALISGTLESLPNGWHLGHSQGAPLSELPLPYPLLDDI